MLTYQNRELELCLYVDNLNKRKELTLTAKEIK